MKRKTKPLVSVEALIMGFVVLACLLLSVFCNAFLWSHIDRALSETPWFIWPARMGLLFVDLVIFAMTLVELLARKIAANGDDSDGDDEEDAMRLRKIMVIWVFILTVIAAVHASNLFVQFSAQADRRDEVSLMVGAAKDLATNQMAKGSEQNRRAAEQAMRMGQKLTAARLLQKEVKPDTGAALKQIAETVHRDEPVGFLPAWYAKKYSFVVLLLSAVLAFAWGGASVIKAREVARRARKARESESVPEDFPSEIDVDEKLVGKFPHR